ncbi:MFS transporter [Streptomyces sp. NPDC015345]|uniref:MFS transporter n=1 Tax=Streptomyces sp. NPDC015345 TaxID=3364953 RepID=UPI00370042F2
MAALLVVTFLARTAITSVVTALTMYVVVGLELSYAAAGGAAAALTIGLALGGPLLGRMLDRRGLRAVLLVTVAVQAVFWLSVTVLTYEALLGAAFAAGLLMVPAQPVTRQAIAAMTTVQQRRSAFALESVQGELSYMVGPAVVILGVALMSPGVMIGVVGGAIVTGGAVMALLDPPLRAVGDVDSASSGRRPRREWLGVRMMAVLLMAFGTTALLSGVDLAVIATLEEAGQVSRAAVVVAVLGMTSVLGGLVYGRLSMAPPVWLLLGLLGLTTIPVGLARDWLWLCVAVVGTGFLAAPTLSAVTEAVSRLAPVAVRGEATGLQSSAQSAGFALGSPIIGGALDAFSPAGGFAVAGLAGCAAALTGWLLTRRSLRGGHSGRPHIEAVARGTSVRRHGRCRAPRGAAHRGGLRDP